MKTTFLLALSLAVSLALRPGMARAQYNAAAGHSAPTVTAYVDEVQKDGTVKKHKVERKAEADHYGNALGNQNDLARDGAFEGQTIAVIQLYDFPFELPRAARFRWPSACRPTWPHPRSPAGDRTPCVPSSSRRRYPETPLPRWP